MGQSAFQSSLVQSTWLQCRITQYTSGSGTFTTGAGTVFMRVRMCGGGGGGGATTAPPARSSTK